MDDAEIPVETPQDAVMASPAEVQQVHDWVSTVLLGKEPASRDCEVRVVCRRQDHKVLRFGQAQAALAEVKANQKDWYGDFYPLTPATVAADQWAAYQFHRADLNAGLVLAFRRAESMYPALEVSLQGLDPALDYAVEFSDDARQNVSKTMTGRELAASMELRLPAKESSLLIRYQPAPPPDQTSAGGRK